MKKRRLLLTTLALSLGCLFGGSGAMAQNGWDVVYNQTQTTSESWTPLTEGSETGKVLGGGSSAPYYYYLTKSLKFANSNAGGSGLTIQGDVYLYIPAGLTITCNGANASGSKGAGAGIELSEGNTLHIMGCGSYIANEKKWVPTDVVVAKGGNAANGSNGGTGTDATGTSSSVWTGTGGNGGDGGGGAGAGIGTRGGAGGAGGAGGSGYKYDDWKCHSGTNGSEGKGGSTAGKMGKLYVDQTFGIRVKATGGAAASSNGRGGQRGRGWAWDGASENHTVAGGGGGGAGGFGGAASNIGSGGPGGGGGGGGAGGAQDWRPNSKGGVNDVTAYGGKGGKDVNGGSAADGVEAATTGTAQSQGWVTVDNGSFSSSDWNSPSGDCSFGSGGSGGGYGSAASNGAINAGQPMEYNITFNAIKAIVDPKDSKARVFTVKYVPSSATTVILPKNEEGYQWAIAEYGKFCGIDGSTVSPFAKASKEFFGGSENDESTRTILLTDVYGDLKFQEVRATCILKSNDDNTEVLKDFFDNPNDKAKSYPISVRLKDRVLYKDKKLNTICLPFDMTPDQISDSPLAGAKIYKMDEVKTAYYPNGQTIPIDRYKVDHPALFLYFEEINPRTNGLVRGMPYLVKWSASSKNLVDNSSGDMDKTGQKVESDDSGKKKEVEIVHQLDFNNVKVQERVAGSWEGNEVTFQGTLSPSEDLKAGDQTILLLGANNTLYYPSETINVGSCRGYFIIPDEAVEAVKTRGILLGFDDDETTGIQTVYVTPRGQNDGATYNLNGQRLNAPQKGINIINGKKVVIK